MCTSNPLVTSGTARVLTLLHCAIGHLAISPSFRPDKEHCVPITQRQSLNNPSAAENLYHQDESNSLAPFMVPSYPISRKDKPRICSPWHCSLTFVEMEKLQQQLLHFAPWRWQGAQSILKLLFFNIATHSHLAVRPIFPQHRHSLVQAALCQSALLCTCLSCGLCDSPNSTRPRQPVASCGLVVRKLSSMTVTTDPSLYFFISVLRSFTWRISFSSGSFTPFPGVPTGTIGCFHSQRCRNQGANLAEVVDRAITHIRHSSQF